MYQVVIVYRYPKVRKISVHAVFIRLAELQVMSPPKGLSRCTTEFILCRVGMCSCGRQDVFFGGERLDCLIPRQRSRRRLDDDR